MARKKEFNADSAPRPDGAAHAASRGIALIPVLASALAVLVGCLVLAGWVLDVGFLKRIVPGAVAMNPVAAICVLLLGASLWLLRSEERSSGTRRGIARAFALAVALVGLIKLTQLVFGWEFGIDRLIFPERVAQENATVGIPNQVAPNTALNLFLLGVSAMLLDWRTRRGRRPAQYLLPASILLSMFAVVGYIFGVKHFSGVFTYVPMALHTGLTFVALAVGFLCARPHRGIVGVVTSDTAGGSVARRLLPAAFLLPVALGWLRLQGQNLGYFDTYFGLTLFTLSMMLTFTVLVGLSAWQLYRTDERRRLAEKKYRSIFENAMEGIYQTTPGGIILTANPGMARILGYDSPEDLMRSVSDAGVQIWTDRDEREEFVRRVQENGSVYDFETRALRKDGREIWMSVNAHAERWSDDGELVAIEGTLVDITERKRAEQELRLQAEIITNMAEGVCLVRVSDGVIVYANRKFEEGIFGYERGELEGRHVGVLHPPDLTPEEIGSAEQIMERLVSGGSATYEARNVRKDGTKIWCRGVASTLDHPQHGKVWVAVQEDITERKQIEVMLRLSEQRYRAVVGSLPDAAISMFDRDLRNVLVGGPALERIGWRKEELEGKTVLEVSPPDRRAGLEAMLRSVLAGESRTFEWRTVRGNRNFSVEMMPVRGDDGEVTGGLIVSRDTTERKLVEAEMQRQANLLEQSHDAIVAWEMDSGGIVYWNRGAQELYGWSAKEAIGRITHELLATERSIDVEAFEAVLLERGRWDGELNHITRDGQEIVVESRHSVMHGESGPAVVLETNRDITERKRMDERLQASQQLLAGIQNSSLDGVMAFRSVRDGGGEISDFEWIAANRASEGMTGRAESELLGKHLLEEMPGNREEGLFDEYVRVVETGEPYKREFAYNHEGIRTWFQNTAVKLGDGFVVTFRDISDEKRTEAELKRLNESLEDSNAELVHKNEEIESFVYSVSHDLRSPLVNLEGFSKELELAAEEMRALLDDEAVPEDVRRQVLELSDEDIMTSVRFIRSGVGRLSGIIDALLRLSRVGRVEYRWRTVDPNLVVERVVEAMGDTISNAGVRVEVAEDMPPVRSDPTALEQVFDNLIGNAIKYLDHSRPGLVEVGCKRGEDGFNTFFVRDNGRGIPETALQKVFRIFQRVHPDVQGEGVGLALVQRLVQRHGGSLRVESTDGEGSTFFLKLPAPEDGEDR